MLFNRCAVVVGTEKYGNELSGLLYLYVVSMYKKELTCYEIVCQFCIELAFLFCFLIWLFTDIIYRF